MRVCHQVVQVLLKTIVVQALESRRIVEVLGHRIGDAGVLAEDVQLEVIGPPVAVAGAATADVGFSVRTLSHDVG